MPSASRTVVIERHIDHVFAFFSTPSNDPQWRPQVKEIEARGPLAVGSRIHQVVVGPGGRGIPADLEVTSYDSPTRYAFEVIVGPVRPTGEFRLEPIGTSTQVTFSLNANLAGVKKLFMSGAVQKSMNAEVAGLAIAKEILERP